jgi:hypothetical protein
MNPHEIEILIEQSIDENGSSLSKSLFTFMMLNINDINESASFIFV